MTVTVHQCGAADLDAATLHALIQLRIEVFVVEQACPYQDLDGWDLLDTTRHFWLRDDDGDVVATLRLMIDGLMNDGDGGFRIGRVCTRRGARGRGHTRRLMEAALAEVGDRPCRLNAQSYLIDMYAAHGFVQDGAEFLEDDIPHVPMLRAAT